MALVKTVESVKGEEGIRERRPMLGQLLIGPSYDDNYLDQLRLWSVWSKQRGKTTGRSQNDNADDFVGEVRMRIENAMFER